MNILTDEEIFKCLPQEESTLDFARAIEAAVLSKLTKQTNEKPVATVVREPGYWDRGHYYEGSKPYITRQEMFKLPVGTKLYTEAQLIAAQQRTAEACARYCAQTLFPSKPIPNDVGRAWIAGTLHCTDRIRNGEWREYL